MFYPSAHGLRLITWQPDLLHAILRACLDRIILDVEHPGLRDGVKAMFEDSFKWLNSQAPDRDAGITQNLVAVVSALETRHTTSAVRDCCSLLSALCDGEEADILSGYDLTVPMAKSNDAQGG